MVRAVVIGAINWDVTLFVKKFPPEGEEAVVTRIMRVPGGKAGNTAVAAARLLGPQQVAIFGGLGKDSIGTEQMKRFEAEGVVTSGLKFCDGTESGQAYVAIDAEGANIVYKLWGANSQITPGDLDDPLRRGLIDEAVVVGIMGPPFETALRITEIAKARRKVVAWDPGVHSELGFGMVRPLLKDVDYVVANEHEVANLTDEKDPVAAARRLAVANERLKIVVKLGARGCLLFSGEKTEVLPGLDLPAAGLKVVNTLGCGDAFLGAFAAALAEGRSDLEALRWGNCAGGLKATKYETRGSPTRETLMKYLS